MKSTFIQDILLIREPAAFKFYKEITVICGYFLAPFFSIALVLEYFGAMDFGGVLKRLLIVAIMMNSFFYIHTTASDTSLEFASETLKKVSPRNLFMKKWMERKVRSKLPSGWDYFWIGNLKDNINDLYATGLFLASKILFIVLKLVYSTVYHLNYAFAGYTALCYFFTWTQGALKGTILSMVWCILQPWVLVGVLAIVGNSFDESALKGEVVGSGVDHMAWLFGVSLLIIATPIITYTVINGGGVQGAGAKVSELVVGAALKSAAVMKGSAISRLPNGFKVMGLKENWNSNKSQQGREKLVQTSNEKMNKGNTKKESLQDRNMLEHSEKNSNKAQVDKKHSTGKEFIVGGNPIQGSRKNDPTNRVNARPEFVKRNEIRTSNPQVQTYPREKLPEKIEKIPTELRRDRQVNSNNQIRKKLDDRLPRVQRPVYKGKPNSKTNSGNYFNR